MNKVVLGIILSGVLLAAGCSDDSSSKDSDDKATESAAQDSKDNGGTQGNNDDPNQGNNEDPSQGNNDDPTQGNDDDPNQGNVEDPNQGNDEDPNQGNDDDPNQEDNETTLNYNYEDVSDIEFAFTSSKGVFSMEDGYIHIVSTEGNRSSSVSNWVLSYNYIQLQACGFSAQIKIGPQMNYSGLQLFKKGSYDDYQINVYFDGKFVVKSPSKTVLTLNADASFITPNEFNHFKVVTADSGNVLFYVNGHIVLTIPKAELEFELTNADKIAALYNVKKTASTTEPAEAWIKLEAVEQPKK